MIYERVHFKCTTTKNDIVICNMCNWLSNKGKIINVARIVMWPAGLSIKFTFKITISSLKQNVYMKYAHW